MKHLDEDELFKIAFFVIVAAAIGTVIVNLQ